MAHSEVKDVHLWSYDCWTMCVCVCAQFFGKLLLMNLSITPVNSSSSNKGMIVDNNTFPHWCACLISLDQHQPAPPALQARTFPERPSSCDKNVTSKNVRYDTDLLEDKSESSSSVKTTSHSSSSWMSVRCGHSESLSTMTENHCGWLAAVFF